MKLILIALHGLFWSIFAIRAVTAYAKGRTGDSETTPASIGVVALHVAGGGALYMGLFSSLMSQQWLWPPLPELGAVFIAMACGLAVWALLVFGSWRLRAQFDSDHELVTRGPYALMRHPIYTAVGLLALGNLVAVPALPMLLGAALCWLSTEVRARYEETVLTAHFAADYDNYAARVRRFVPFVY